jgi:hypothetical protein
MNPQLLIRLIGTLLTEIDDCLARPDFPDSDPRWHQLFALRKALDDQQRQLVSADFQVNTTTYATLTQQIAGANQQLQNTIANIQMIGNTIAMVTQVIGFVGQLLQFATA